MERAAAVLVGGVGVVLLTLAALATVGDDDPTGGGVDLAVVATTAPVTGATVLGITASSAPPAPATTAAAPGAAPGPSTPTPSSSAPTAPAPPPPTATTATTAAPPVTAPPPPPGLLDAARAISDGGVRFGVGKAELDATAVARLERLAAELRARPDVAVVVVGHTDSTGGDEINRPLSERRARAVIDFLVGQGVQPGQLRSQGVGPDRPVADNQSVAGRQANRRSEVSVDPGS